MTGLMLASGARLIPAAPLVVRTRAELADARAALTGSTASVFTLGALHDAHLANMRLARTQADSLVVTIFVNPLQFGPDEDLARYPRTLEADLAVCAEAGASIVFAPDVATMYPDGDPVVRLDPGPLGGELEGVSRPGHLGGMLVVVAKLLGLTRCDLSVFGEKDYQQLVLVRRMAADLEIGTRIVAAPIVRDADGLAVSSRNRYLSADERRSGLALSAAMRAGRQAALAGGGSTDVCQAARTVLDAVPGVDLDYLALRGTELDGPPANGAARLLVAARIGNTRLIDNAPIELGSVTLDADERAPVSA